MWLRSWVVLLIRFPAVFVFFFSLLEYFWATEATFGRQAANVANDVPRFLVTEDAFPAWHATEPNAIVDDPLQLAVSVALYARRSEIGDRWHSAVGNWNASVL